VTTGSVRLRVTIAAAGLFAVALGVASFWLVRSVHDNLADEIERTNTEQLEVLAAQLEAGVAPDDLDVPAPGPGGPPAYRVVGPGGRPLDADDVPGLGPRFRTIPLSEGDPSVRARRQIETAAGRVTLVAERSLDEVDRTVDSVTRVLVIGVPLLVGLVAVLTWWLAGRALRPVEAIRAEAAAITASTIHRRVPEPDTDDEIGRLARTMNSMLDRLEHASLQQRRFVSDASHELRSPVASIRTQLEVALRRDDPDWPTVAEKVLAEDRRLDEAVTELLELARAEEGKIAEPTDVDLDEIVLEETARGYPVPIDTRRVSAGRVRGNGAQLARAVRNLLDNAARHARAHVEVSLEARDDDVVLTVDDDGPGIPTDERSHVFDRFTRLDEGRARDAGGVGLGLPIVRAVAERHSGTVTVEDAPIGGARFVLRLPAA
jgi:signal transduction histidine kinase